MTLFALALIACSPTDAVDPVQPHVRQAPVAGPAALLDDTRATNSNSIASIGRVLYTANLDSGSVTRLDPVTQATLEVDVGVEPTRIATTPEAVYVTLRGQREIVKLSPDLQELARVEVGPEPFGVVAREDGTRIYVSLSQADTIVELDADLNELARFPIGGEPRGMALHPSGVTLYVGLGQGEAGLGRLDLINGLVTPVSLPQTTRNDTAMTPQVSGDPAITAQGDQLVVPVLYLATNEASPVIDRIEDVVQPGFPGQESPYGGRGDRLGKVSPTLVEVELDATGQVGASRALFVSASEFGMNDMLDFGFGAPRTITGYISGVVASPDGSHYLASMEGAGLTVLVNPDVEVSSQGDFALPFNNDFDGDGIPDEDSDGPMDFGDIPSENGFISVASAAMEAGPGVDGAVFIQGRAYTNDRFEHTVTQVDLPTARQWIEDAANFGITPQGVVAAPLWMTYVGDSPVSATVRLGRELFHSTRSSAMGAGGISCSSCHTDGRTDGITWFFTDGPRQTPSLAGRVSDTEPVTWRSAVSSVREEAEITTRGRMGGHGLEAHELDAIAAYVDWTRLPDRPNLRTVSVARGQGIFLEAGCASCHQGVAQTDNRAWTIREVELNTPTLRGIASTAPYLHDGSAPSLRDVLELGRTGEMGVTSHLDEDEMTDLVNYLETL